MGEVEEKKKKKKKLAEVNPVAPGLPERLQMSMAFITLMHKKLP